MLNYANVHNRGMSQTTANIQALRKSGLTQTEIAKQSGVPQCRISRWEKGEVPKAADDALKLEALARAMDVLARQDLAASQPTGAAQEVANA